MSNKFVKIIIIIEDNIIEFEIENSYSANDKENKLITPQLNRVRKNNKENKLITLIIHCFKCWM